MEKWHNIELTNYQVSDMGNLRHIKFQRKRKLRKGTRGYIIVILEGKSYQLHRLVAKAFIPNPDNFGIVNHIDGNPLNNCADNLEWCTQSHNCLKGNLGGKKRVYKHLTIKERSLIAMLSKHGYSIRGIARITKRSRHAIRKYIEVK